MSERLPASVTHLSARCFLSAPTCNLHTRITHALVTHGKRMGHTLWPNCSPTDTPNIPQMNWRYHHPIPNNNRRSSAASSPDSSPRFHLTGLTLSLQPIDKNSSGVFFAFCPQSLQTMQTVARICWQAQEGHAGGMKGEQGAWSTFLTAAQNHLMRWALMRFFLLLI